MLNLSSLLLYRRCIARLISRDHSSPMSASLDRFDAAEIFAFTSVEAMFEEDVRNQLQSNGAVDVMIECFDLRFIDSIIAESCATPRLVLKRTLAKLQLTLGGVYSAAMIACDETLVRCEKKSPEGTLFIAFVFCFRIRTYYAARQVVAMFNRRFDSRPIAKRLSVCYVPISHRRSVELVAQSVTDTSSSLALHPTTTQQSLLLCKLHAYYVLLFYAFPFRCFFCLIFLDYSVLPTSAATLRFMLYCRTRTVNWVSIHNKN